MTYTDPEIIREMLENDGVYPGDPRMALIYSYDNAGRPHYAVFADSRHDDVHLSPWVQNPVLLWSATDGLTERGAAWLNDERRNR